MKILTPAPFFGLALLMLLTVLDVRAQVALERMGTGVVAGVGTHYQYTFENERFTTPFIEVQLDGKGMGRFRFRKRDTDEISTDISVSPLLVQQIQGLFDALNFLDSKEEYQYKKDFSHLGKVTLKLNKDGRQRSVTFNYTSNQSVTQLADIFRNIATQETRVMEIESTRETDPLSMPAQLRILESELKSRQIAEPDRLKPLLEKLKVDESLPLIARNHADRLIKSIDKSK
jgi:hypothetical protein